MEHANQRGKEKQHALAHSSTKAADVKYTSAIITVARRVCAPYQASHGTRRASKEMQSEIFFTLFLSS